MGIFLEIVAKMFENNREVSKIFARKKNFNFLLVQVFKYKEPIYKIIKNSIKCGNQIKFSNNFIKKIVEYQMLNQKFKINNKSIDRFFNQVLTLLNYTDNMENTILENQNNFRKQIQQNIQNNSLQFRFGLMKVEKDKNNVK